jgi:UDP-N-acetylmuramate dehydrogenase
MELRENEKVGSKTTMRVGGTSRYFAELKTTQDVEEAVRFATEKGMPLIPLGGGSNTVFCDDTLNALVVRIKADDMTVDGRAVTVKAGKILASLINELGEKGLDLSALTGIPGTVGGALFGNAGQGPKGVWLDSFVESVTAYIDGEWKTLSKEDCAFRYRESGFKDRAHGAANPPIIWEATLNVPAGEPAAVKGNVEALLKKRFETQPHLRTAGSCFKAVGGTPAWQLIDAAGLRGLTIGGAQVAEKHANFLLNVGNATYADLKAVVGKVKTSISEPLSVEMRFIEPDGTLAY